MKRAVSLALLVAKSTPPSSKEFLSLKKIPVDRGGRGVGEEVLGSRHPPPIDSAACLPLLRVQQHQLLSSNTTPRKRCPPPEKNLLSGGERQSDKSEHRMWPLRSCNVGGGAPPPPYNSSTASRIRHLVVIDLTDRVVPYEIAWAAQHALLQHQMLQLESHKTKAKEEPKSGSYLELLPGIAPCRVSGETACDFAILTQHPSVYTLGQGSSLSFVAADMRDKESQLKLPLELQQDVQDASQVAKALGDLASAIAALRAPERGDLKGPSEGAPGLVGAPQKGRMRDGRGPPQLLRVERGGQVTWHGPGQLVVYPIFDLRKHQTDIRAFIDALETTAAQSLVPLLAPTTVQEHAGCLGRRPEGKEATNACEWIRFLLQQVQQLQQHEEHQQITQELQHGLQQHETVQSHSSLLPIAATCVVEALRQTFGAVCSRSLPPQLDTALPDRGVLAACLSAF
ncbi:lipoyl transferase [Cyclospora cayetanensis]|uniref:Lipoyl transferase n=1 Tax=Cyclospora cayetanensis TaxID=88456 RepID=A0A1D3D035_9EIME|nr:lipoyl transferase [Cyclospora cayetanensis]